MKTICSLCVLLVLTLLLAACQPTALTSPVTPTPERTLVPPGSLVLHNGTVIDGRGGEPIPGGLVAIRGGKILFAGREADFYVPANAIRIDVQGGTILPGLIDARVHVLAADGAAVEPLENWLQAGVTGLRDLGAPLRGGSDPSASIAGVQARLAKAGQRIPAVLLAGPVLTAPGGYPAANWGGALTYPIADLAAARQATRDLLDGGADLLVISVENSDPVDPQPVLSGEQVAEIVRLAHQRSKRVVAFARSAAGAQLAVENGVDELAQAPLFGRLSDELIAYMVSHDVLLTPSLAAQANQAVGLSPAAWETAQQTRTDNLQRFLAAGGRVALGSAYGEAGIPQGVALAEISALREAGLSPMQIIVAATYHAALACDLEGRLGSLEPSKQADVIVVAGDPLQDITALAEVRLVIKNGEIAADRME